MKKRIIVKKEEFKDQDIRLDGHSWSDCIFRGCIVIVEKGDFDLIHCDFHECKLSLDGGAVAIAKVIDLFQPPDKKLTFIQ